MRSDAMPDWLADRPFALVLGILYAAATVRGQTIYGLARWAVEQSLRHPGGASGWRARLNLWLAGDQVAAGRRALERWGLPIIPLSYLTVGFQSVVHAAAGVMRVNWVRFTLAQIPGALAWALIYATIGFAAWEAAAGAAAGSPWGAALLGLIVLGGVTYVVRRRFSAGRSRG